MYMYNACCYLDIFIHGWIWIRIYIRIYVYTYVYIQLVVPSHIHRGGLHAGFLMVAGDLATAAELKLTPIIVVFVDASLALIEKKQRERQMTNLGVDFAKHDFAALGVAFGGAGATVRNREELADALITAQNADTFTVIAAIIERGAYDGKI